MVTKPMLKCIDWLYLYFKKVQKQIKKSIKTEINCWHKKGEKKQKKDM